MKTRRFYSKNNAASSKNKKNIILFCLIAFSALTIVYSVYYFTSQKPGNGQKLSTQVQTGDQPLAKQQVVYVNADGGLSLRGSRDTSSKRLALIPNNTKLTVTEELDGWYKVSYENKEGWISKQYTTVQAPPEDPTKDWQSYTSTAGYKVKYEPGWKAQDYGKNDSLGAVSIVAFSNQELPATIPTGTDFIAPVVVKISTKSADEINKGFAAMPSVQIEALSIAGKAAQKYTYMTPSTNTQVTAVVLSNGSQVYVFSEAGGYADDLLKMLNTFTIG